MKNIQIGGLEMENKWDDNFRPDGIRTQCHECGAMIDTEPGKWHIDYILHQLSHKKVIAKEVKILDPVEIAFARFGDIHGYE